MASGFSAIQNNSGVSQGLSPRLAPQSTTYCAIGNAYGGLPSNLMFPIDRSLLLLPLLLTARTPRRSAHRHRYAAYLCPVAGIEWMTRSASRAARIIQMLMRIRAVSCHQP